ncbi:MAG: IS4 family transposase [Bacteroidales bacterium]|nr:IS4 family transposase [Bacteroidales bacterium]
MIFYNKINQISKFKTQKLPDVLSLLDEDMILSSFTTVDQRQRKYHILPLLHVFMMQVACQEPCRQAIFRGKCEGTLPPDTSIKTAAYCNARNRLPEDKVKGLFIATGEALWKAAREQWLFCDRHVKVVDATDFTLPDTCENQAEYPQPSGQKAGCGFPKMNVSVLMDLESGAFIDAETVAGTGYEHPLFRRLWRSLIGGDIVLGDGLYGSFAEIAELLKMGVDGLFRDGTKKFKDEDLTPLDDGEWLYVWHRPSLPGKWVSIEKLPETITVRVIRFEAGLKGFRKKQVTMYTTLMDTEKYPREKLINLYYRRWEIELAFKNIKTTMGLKTLRCKSPSACRKELWIGLLVYNFIRTIMLDASIRHKISVLRLSFAGTIQKLVETCHAFAFIQNPEFACEMLIRSIVDDVVPLRPGRFEPRKVKRRNNKYSYLTETRELERKELMKWLDA